MARHAYLLLVVLIGWALFYYTDMTRLAGCLRVLTGAASGGWMGSSTVADLASHGVWLILAILGCVPIASWLKQRGWHLELSPPRARTGWAALIAVDTVLLAASTVSLVGQGYNPFIYYRF
jgi:alginate O-acetyltransferase complex protein AlgI